MTLTLQLRERPKVPLEVEGVTPAALADKSLNEIEGQIVFHGNREVPLAEFFRVSGSASDRQIVFEGECQGVHWIGAKMTDGSIRVEGDAGRHVGSEMSGGTIEVTGDAGDWLGGEMRGGTIRVHGSAGHLVGAAYRGSPRGMIGGSIYVSGGAGNEIGHSLRRGTIAIGGDFGDLAGFNMLAGTILAFGNGGIRHGAGMRRGTIGIFGSEPVGMLPTFRYASLTRPLAIEMLIKQCTANGIPVADDLHGRELHLFHGDFLESGRGEILVANRG